MKTARRNIVKLKDDNVVFTVIGISSHENDYRLSWSINEHLSVTFVHSNNLVIDGGKEFTCFIHIDDTQRLMLVSNRCDNGFLLEKYKNLDFILKFHTELEEDDVAVWMHNLRKVPLISAVFPIPVNKQVLSLLT